MPVSACIRGSLPDKADDLWRPTIPWDTVPDQDPPRHRCVDLGQRGECRGWVIRERGGLRTDRSSQDLRAGGQGIADHDRIERREVVAEAARRVAGKRDDVRRTRDVEGLATDQLVHLREVRRAKPSVSAGIGQESKDGADLEAAPARLRLVLSFRAGGVRLMDVDRHVRLATEALGEPDMVGVAMRDEHRTDIREGPAHGLQLVQQLAPLARHPGVDDRHATGILDEVGGDDVVADPVQRGRELHADIPFHWSNPSRPKTASSAALRTMTAPKMMASVGSPVSARDAAVTSMITVPIRSFWTADSPFHLVGATTTAQTMMTASAAPTARTHWRGPALAATW